MTDAPALHDAVHESLDTVGRWLTWCNAAYSLGDAQSWIQLCEQHWSTNDADREFGVFDSAGHLLGCAGINQRNLPNRFANLGYWIRRAAAQRGVATTAASMLADFAFTELRLTRIEIVVLPDNLASRRVAEKLGCECEGLARNRLIVGGSARDALMYSLIPGTTNAP